MRPMPLIALCVALAAILCVPAFAQQTGTDDEGFWAGYWRYIQRRADELMAMEDQLWGVQSLVNPKGVFSVKLIVNCKRADSKYRDDGTCGPVIDPISFPDPLGTGDDFMTLKIKVKGRGCGWLFRMFYGISDPLDVFINIHTQTQELWMDLDFEPGTSSMMGIRTEEDLYELLELLGRPRPKTYYRSESLELGDIDIGVLYNYFRNDYISAMVKPRIIFPTGKLADPNSALIFALGPEIDIGKGSFGLGLTHNLDLRPPKPAQWLIFALQINYIYYLRGRHPAPTFQPPDPTAEGLLDSVGFESDYFPDLSDIGDYYYVTPGNYIEAVANLVFSGSFFAFGLGYGYMYQQKPIVETSSAEFKRMMELFNSYAEQEAHGISVIAAFRLFHFMIPAILNLEARYPVGGRNYFKFEDDYKLDFQVFLPL